MLKKNKRSGGKWQRVFMAFACTVMLSVSVGGMNAYAYENTVGVINEGGARIRSSASTDSSVLASVGSGDKVEICGEETASDGYTWYKIYVNGKTIGYVRADLVTNTGEKTGGVTDNAATGNVGQGDDTQNDDSQEQPADDVQTDNTQTDGDSGVESPLGGDAQITDTPTVNNEIGLAGLSISNGTVIPAFSPEVTEYTISVGEEVTSIAAYGVPSGEGVTVIENYGFSELEKGSNMAVITVAGPDGTTKSYYFTVNRGEPSSEIHYSDPNQVGESATDPDEVQANEKKENSHTGLIVFLVIVILAMAAVLVLMGLRIRDYRRDLYGEDPEEFHLRDAIPENSVFRRPLGTKQGTLKRRVSGRTEEFDMDDEEDVYDDEEDSRETYKEKNDTQKRARMYDTDVTGKNIEESAVNESLGNLEDGFLYDIKKVSEDADQIQDPGMQYQTTGNSYDSGNAYGMHGDAYEHMSAYQNTQTESDFDEDEEDEVEGIGIDPDDDELEDIMERNATITDQENGKEVWKSVNFMTPAEDLEFEFLDLEDENE